MQVLVLAIGRLRPALRSAADDYLTRLRRYWPVEEREIREPARTAPDPVRRREEGRRLLTAVPAGALIVALTRAGTPWSSAELARRVDHWRGRAGPVAILIGGASGLAEPVLSAASARWSLGPLTLPHELARVVVLEQLYRAGTILHGHPYHRSRS